MRLFPFLFVLLFFTINPAIAQQESRSGVMTLLQKLGANFGQAEQELLPPDEAFKLAIEVKDEHTLIAHFTPAKNYYLYRDKIAFEPQSEGIQIEKISLPPGKMKDDLTFGKTEVYYQPFQAVIALKRGIEASDQVSLASTYQGCNEPVGVCYAPIKKINEVTLPAIKTAVNTVAETLSGNAAAAPIDSTAALFQTPSRPPAIETESFKIEQMSASGSFGLILAGFFGIGLLLSFHTLRISNVPHFILDHRQSKPGDMTKGRGFLCLQEYFYSPDTRFFETEQSLLRDFRFVAGHQRYTNKAKYQQHFGIATFSTHPIIRKGHIDFPENPENACIWTDIALKDDTIRVYNAHLASYHFGDEDYKFIKALDTDTHTDSLKLGGVRILKRLRRGFRLRADEVQRIAEHMKASPHPLLYCGDMNDVPMSYGYATLRDLLSDAFVESGSGTGGTYIGDLPSLRIDHILYGDGLHAWGFQTLGEELSDHRAITTWIGAEAR